MNMSRSMSCYPLKGSMKIIKLNKDAKIPTKGSKYAAGFDVYANEESTIPPFEKKLISLGIILQIPHGMYGRLASRSSLSLKHGIEVGAGVIDSDYRGEVKILLYNFSRKTYHVSKGDRIGQIIIECCNYPNIEVIKSIDELEQTQRNHGGFGSTGI